MPKRKAIKVEMLGLRNNIVEGIIRRFLLLGNIPQINLVHLGGR